MIALLIAAAIFGAACTAIAGEAAGLHTTTTTRPTTTTTRAAASTASSTSTVTAAPSFVPAPVEWRGCGGKVKCATLDVPLDYADPTGPTITLGLNELPARNQGERIGALLVNPGGPGGSGLEFVAAGVALPSSVLDR